MRQLFTPSFNIYWSEHDAWIVYNFNIKNSEQRIFIEEVDAVYMIFLNARKADSARILWEWFDHSC